MFNPEGLPSVNSTVPTPALAEFAAIAENANTRPEPMPAIKTLALFITASYFGQLDRRNGLEPRSYRRGCIFHMASTV
jgi:hypothetical protein